MTRTRGRVVKAAGAALLAWTALFGPFYAAAWRTGLPGMRGGPQDAFRHTLGSAVLACWVSPKAVDLFTKLTESERSMHGRMDKHNNRIGRDIGAASGSAREAYGRVASAVAAGREDSKDPAVITWLPERYWTRGL